MLYLLRDILRRNFAKEGEPAEHRAVVFQHCKAEVVYAFVPPRAEKGETEYKVYRTTGFPFNASECALLDDRRTFYLIDPPEKEGGPPMARARVVIAASPNEKHYRTLLKEKGRAYFMPPWSLDELLAVHKAVASGTIASSSAPAAWRRLTDGASAKRSCGVVFISSAEGFAAFSMTPRSMRNWINKRRLCWRCPRRMRCKHMLRR